MDVARSCQAVATGDLEYVELGNDLLGVCRCTRPSTPSGDAYMSDDDVWHRSDGRGRAWF